MTLKSVVFPAPFGPRMARRSPCSTSRSTSGHRHETAEAPADPPQAESRRGTRSDRRSFAHVRYLIVVFVITPFLTTLIFPAHGVFSFLHAGWERPGGGLEGLNRPPNDWSTFGM